MPSLLPGYEYDIFISYRHNDNKRDGWVREFVAALKAELEATLKDPLTIYFDENPHDGLLETHQVDPSLAKKLKCLVFIPIVSQTYCDTKSFAWQHEFLAFSKLAGSDSLGMNITLGSGNVASRILPIQIHDLDPEDRHSIETVLGGPLRSIPFIYTSAGVNRPLRSKDAELGDNQNKTNYLNQINKVANALKEISTAIVRQQFEGTRVVSPSSGNTQPQAVDMGQSFWGKLRQRNVPRAGIAYLVMAWFAIQVVELVSRLGQLPQSVIIGTAILVALGFPIALVLAWKFERSPAGFVLTDSPMAKDSPFRPSQKKPLSSNGIILGILLLSIGISATQRYWLPNDRRDKSIAIIPFQSNSNDPNQANYGVGLASEIRTALSQSKQFEFISSLQATRQYAKSDDSPVSIGSSLGVTHILSGFYEVSGTAIQVTVELVDARQGNIIWSFPYKSDLNDIFKIQADIAAKVLDKFEYKGDASMTSNTTNLPAYTHFLKGVELLNAGWREDIFNKAIEEFETTIQLDSSYLPAWVGLINARADMIWEINADDSIMQRKTRENIAYIHSHFPESYLTKLAEAMYQYHVRTNFNQALKLFEEVLEVDPENIVANNYCGALYKRRLEFSKAITLLSKSKNQWPKSVTVWSEIGEVLLSMGDYENEAKVNKLLLELSETDVGLVRTFNYYRNGGILEKLPKQVIDVNPERYAFALSAQRRDWQSLRGLLDTTTHPLGRRMFAYNAMGLTDSAQYLARQYLKTVKINKELYDPGLVAMSYATLGQEDLAIKAVDSLVFNNDNLVPINPEDLLMQARQRLNKVSVMVQAQDYPGATELLKSINREYPNYGDYAFISTSPAFDRIKKEYPPFLKALSELKLPMKLELEKYVKL